jgi:hypothetical protein
MIDIHPPQHTAITRRDFFVHLGIVVLGILIAIGLEQSVEYFHHRHQRAELVQQMRAEAQHNLPILHKNIDKLLVQFLYIKALHDALVAAKVTPTGVDVAGVPPPGVTVVFTTASRGTWQAAQGAGLAALLPAEQAKLFARLDFNAQDAENDENPMILRFGELASECDRAGYDHFSPAISHITLVEQRDLIYKTDQLNNLILRMAADMAIFSGGDEAIVAGANTLDQMYPYQEAAFIKTTSATDFGRNSFAGFFGRIDQTKDHPDFGASRQPK